jgi:hypothetical protein
LWEGSPVGESARKVRFVQGERVRLGVCVSYCVWEREGSRERERARVARCLIYYASEKFVSRVLPL